MFEGSGRDGSIGWASEARSSFLGTRPEQWTKPYLPTPRGNLLAGGDPPIDMFMSSMRSHHRHPGISPREIRSLRPNDPSEPDHPMFGLHDPSRSARLKGTFGESMNRETYIAPHRSAYSSPRRDPPYADRAQEAFIFDSHPRHTSEQRANYAWPAFISQAPVIRPKPEWVLE